MSARLHAGRAAVERSEGESGERRRPGRLSSTSPARTLLLERTLSLSLDRAHTTPDARNGEPHRDPAALASSRRQPARAAAPASQPGQGCVRSFSYAAVQTASRWLEPVLAAPEASRSSELPAPPHRVTRSCRGRGEQQGPGGGARAPADKLLYPVLLHRRQRTRSRHLGRVRPSPPSSSRLARPVAQADSLASPARSPDGGANGAPEPPSRATDVDSLMDAVGASGVDLGVRRSSSSSSSPRPSRPPRSLRALARRPRKSRCARPTTASRRKP